MDRTGAPAGGYRSNPKTRAVVAAIVGSHMTATLVKPAVIAGTDCTDVRQINQRDTRVTPKSVYCLPGVIDLLSDGIHNYRVAGERAAP